MTETPPVIVDSRTQLRFNTSQFLQIVIFIVTMTLAWSDIKHGLADLKAAFTGVYTKVEIDKTQAKTDSALSDHAKRLKKLYKALGLEEE